MDEKTKEPSFPRQRAVYWVPGNKDKKDLLIFDGGYEDGSIHIYEIKESILFEEVVKEFKKMLNLSDSARHNQDMIITSWIEHKFGYPQIYNISP